MLKGYIGTANHYGLEAFLADDDHTTVALVRLAHQACRQAYFWAAVDDELAHEIQRQLYRGLQLEALLLLEQGAQEIRPLEISAGAGWQPWVESGLGKNEHHIAK